MSTTATSGHKSSLHQMQEKTRDLSHVAGHMSWCWMMTYDVVGREQSNVMLIEQSVVIDTTMIMMVLVYDDQNYILILHLCKEVRVYIYLMCQILRKG